MGRSKRLLLDSLVLGVVGALSAQAFTYLLGVSEEVFLKGLAGYQPPGLPEEGGVLKQFIGPHGLWLIPLATALGGLISGLLVFSLAPEAEGHGTDSAVKSFHRAGGYIRARVPFVKMVASAITIGSGGAAGREGPTALISAGIGSIYAGFSHRSDEDRRTLILVGMAAGLSAIFRSPLGCAVFAVEVLYRETEYESGVLFYTIVASLTAYVVNSVFVGGEPLFRVPAGLSVGLPEDLAWYALLGVAAGIVATALPWIFYRVRDAFHAIPLPAHVKPAIGGLGVGLLALLFPQVLGGGYGWMQEAIDGNLAWTLMLALLFLKTAAFSLTVSSGGSGGIFAPCLFVGAMLGGFLAKVFGQPSACFVVVGTLSVFGAAARTPFATLLMVAEMTGGYQLLVPAAIALAVSCALQVALSRDLPYKSLYEAQVPTKADSPAHHAEKICAALELLRCPPLSSSSATARCSDLARLLESGVPVELAGGFTLGIVELSSSCPHLGKPLEQEFLSEKLGADGALVGIIRKGAVLAPGSELIAREGDRLLTISPKAYLRLNEAL